MSFKKCINDGVSEGLIKQDQADEVFELFDDLETQYNTQMGGAAASAKASIDATAAIKKLKADKKRQALLQAQTWKKITKDFSTYKNGNDINRAALSLFERDEFTIKGFNSVHDLERVNLNKATREMDEFLATFRRNIVGETRNKARLKNVLKEVFDEDTGDVFAKQLAQAWKVSSNNLRMRFNAAGGAIGKIDDWGMPQNHNVVKVRQASFDEWRSFILPRLNLNKMLDETTQLKFSPEKLEITLKDVYETIATDGYNKLTPGGVMGGKSLANRKQDHRFLIFKDSDSWQQYQEAFGNKNPFDTMMAHISTMSRDIALMERLGPNPNATVNFVKQTIAKENALKGAFENLRQQWLGQDKLSKQPN